MWNDPRLISNGSKELNRKREEIKIVMNLLLGFFPDICLCEGKKHQIFFRKDSIELVYEHWPKKLCLHYVRAKCWRYLDPTKDDLSAALTVFFYDLIPEILEKANAKFPDIKDQFMFYVKEGCRS